MSILHPPMPTFQQLEELLTEAQNTHPLAPGTFRNRKHSLRILRESLGLNATAVCDWLLDEAEFMPNGRVFKALEKHTSNAKAQRVLASDLRYYWPLLAAAMVNPPGWTAPTFYEAYRDAALRALAHGKLEQLTWLSSKRVANPVGNNPRRKQRPRILSRTDLVNYLKSMSVSDALDKPKVYFQGDAWKTKIATISASIGVTPDYFDPYIHVGPAPGEPPMTRYAIRQQERVTFTYSLSWDKWPPSAQREFKALTHFKSHPATAAMGNWTYKEKDPGGIPQAGEPLGWNILKFSPDKISVWKEPQKGHEGTVIKFRRDLASFYGFCCLPKEDHTHMPTAQPGDSTPRPINIWRTGLGMKPEDVGLHLLAIKEIVVAYIEFKMRHTLGETEFLKNQGEPLYNGGCNQFVSGLAAALMNPQTGFIYLSSPEFLPKLQHLVEMEVEDNDGNKETYTTPSMAWRKFCERINKEYLEYDNSQKQLFKASSGRKTRNLNKSRDPAEPIQTILDMKDPLEALKYFLDSIRLNPYPAENKAKRAEYDQTRLFFELMCKIPLRISHFGAMTPKHFQKVGDCYVLRFLRSEFKNHRFLDQDFTLTLPASLTPLIEDVKALWPTINAGRELTENSHIFAKGNRLHTLPLGKRIDNIKKNLALRCCRWTGKHLSQKYGSKNFGPHAFRHLIATAVIKKTQSFEAAAVLLWDKVETVQREYAHVRRSDYLKVAVDQLHDWIESAKPTTKPLYQPSTQGAQ